jgi:transposase
VFFDTTSTYFEGQGSPGLVERGYSRDKRLDLKQVIIGLVITRESIPVAHTSSQAILLILPSFAMR